jgi:uncharacterized membrane protein YdcZ (DUF606 family)
LTARGGVRGMALLLVLLAAAAGMAITTQFAVNSELGRAAGGALAASAISFGFIIAGQMVASVVLDQFGLLNLDVHRASLARLAGVALVVLGAFLVLRF